MEITVQELEALFENSSYTKEEIIKTFKAFEKSQRTARVPARVIFDDWREVMEEPRGILDPARVRLINRALDNYTVEELKLAIRGCVLSPWHMGTDPANKTGQVVNFPELIFQNSAQIEKFIAIAKHHKITHDAKIRRSDYDGSKPKQVVEYTEFTPGKRI